MAGVLVLVKEKVGVVEFMMVPLAKLELPVPFGTVAVVMVVSGRVMSTINVRLAGVISVLPTISIARTSNVCEPLLSPVYIFGEVQLTQDHPSIRHSKVDPDSVALKLKLCVPVFELVPEAIPAVIVVSGGVVSQLITLTVTVPVFERSPAVSRTR